MGTFGNSFKRELGKNTAKVVSNVLFGDKFATPYRIIHKQQEQRKNERVEAREYKQHLIEQNRQEKQLQKENKEYERQVAAQDKQRLISENTKEVQESNSYITVIQSVHKDYSDPVDWDEILERDPPTEVKPTNELRKHYKDFTNNQIDKEIADLKKNTKFSIVQYLLKGMYSKKYKWILKITGHKNFLLISLSLALMTFLYFMADNSHLKYTGSGYYITLLLLILFVIAFIFSALSKYALSDTELKISLDKAIEDLESNRVTWYNEYLEEHENAYNDYILACNDHANYIKLANRVKEGDKEAFIDAIDFFNPFEDIEEYGSDIQYSFVNNQLTVDFFVRSDEVVPNFTKRLLRNGLEIKEDPIPTARFLEIYQDYVCSFILRIAKEVFAIIPIHTVLINAMGNVLNNTTGNYEEQIIVSVLIEQAKLDRLNFDLLDPSNSMSNFTHHMNFNKAYGFYAVSGLIFSDPDAPLMLSPIIESDLSNIWNNPKYQALCKYNYYFPDSIENNSILFIGLNPSFSEEQLESSSYKLSQRNNKSQYFKKFEDISEFCNTKWSHLDLLFFRETKQTTIDEMMRLDNGIGVGFIWEQLQISKRIIEACRPKVIVVCNAQAATFLGKNKKGNQNVWLDFNFIPDENTGSFIWNNITVLFTRPLSGLGTIDNSSYDQLKLQIKKAIYN